MTVPTLDGIHHIKSRLGHRRRIEFGEHGVFMGLSLTHPRGWPALALRPDPERSSGLGDFVFFAEGVPDKPALETPARHLTEPGERHAGMHVATIGWVLPGLLGLHDPDGHEVRFYTTEHRAPAAPERVLQVNDPVETALRHERHSGTARLNPPSGPDRPRTAKPEPEPEPEPS